SVLLTQLVYSGMIDERIGIVDNTIHIPESMLTDKPVNNGKTVSVRLNSTDIIYTTLRDTAIDNISTSIKNKLDEYSSTRRRIKETISNVGDGGNVGGDYLGGCC
ncbi:MAG: hypothetical protein O7C59_05815, partial [Rickettsia endosymbiont of Ixodes persulcatus]|nr:hypothetical protein [Rickettsia endosymbiont of Ixodes persulcatus]